MFEENYEKQILISKIKDKINFCKYRNSVEYTDFLDLNQKSLALDVLKQEKFNNYIVNDDENEFDRNIIILYPEKLEKEEAKKYYKEIVCFIKIKNEKREEYEHRVYLSGMMKLGIKREKFGDILVNKNEASIIILKELAEYISSELKSLKRFQNSKINIGKIENLEIKKPEFEDFNIIVHSLRIDSFVSEIAKYSRTKAKETIEEGFVLINNRQETKISKNLNLGDIITIRKKGKFIFDKIENKTKKDNLIVNMKKYK